jgi:hypothetical protein
MRTTTAFLAGASAFLTSFVPSVLAHGQIHAVESSSGGYVEGPNVYYDGDAKNKKTPVRKMLQSSGKAFILPSDYSNPVAMSCESAGGAPATLDVNAGDNVKIFWEGATPELKGMSGLNDYNPWVHAMGPIFDYIAECDGDCSKFDATNADWVKLAQFGLDTSSSISGDLKNRMAAKPEPYNGKGKWALAKMIEEYSTWSVKIPAQLKPGQYIVRNEVVAVHSPRAPQHYIACVQINVKGSGTTSLPAGTKSNNLYNSNSILATYDVYAHPESFALPASPAVWNPSSDSAPPPPPPASSAQPAPSSSKPAPPPASSQAAPPPAPSSSHVAPPPPASSSVTSSKPAAAPTSAAVTSSAPAPVTTKKCNRKGKKRSVRKAREARVHRRTAVYDF